MGILSNLFRAALFAVLAAPVAGKAQGVAGDEYDYAFSLPFHVTEVVTAACAMPCATLEVRDIELFLDGGFNVAGNGTITGKGTISVHGDPLCRIVSQGGAAASCRVVGSKAGYFLVSGLQTGVQSPSGAGFAPSLSLTFEIGQQADLFVVFSMGGGVDVTANHYQGSFTRLMTDGGLVAVSIDIQPVRGAGRDFAASFALPAPGFSRVLSAEGALSFYKSPFLSE